MGEVDKIVIESYENGFCQLYELDKPELVKVTLVVDGTNVALYEGKEFKRT
jgi:predicted P-loop ATPase/GTPase